MSRKGRRPASAKAPGDKPAPSLTPFRSHTSTEQWQSFEMRMRRRRAERCVLRAEVALEAGFDDDARAALDEARTLDASAPDFDAVLATVVARLREAVAADERRRRQRGRRFAAAAALVAACVAGSANCDGSADPTPQVGDARMEEVASPRRAW